MYFHSVTGKNIKLSSDSSEAKRVNGFCDGITFSNNPLVQFQRVTFQIGQIPQLDKNDFGNKQNVFKKLNKKSLWNGNLRIGLTTKNPITLTSSELPDFSYPTLLNTDCYWITCIKSSYLKPGNKISLVLDKNNSLQVSVNYVVKANLFGNNTIPNTASTKLWLILDLYGNTNMVQFLPSGKLNFHLVKKAILFITN
jgi:protein neuralized